jgi:hypothetical protein
MALLRVMMREGENGLPQVGDDAFQLGVRPAGKSKRPDVTVSKPDDILSPTSGEGLSCSASSLETYLAREFVQKVLNFRPDRAVWEIEVDDLPDGLQAIPRPDAFDPLHVQIEPTRDMTLGAFQTLLASTARSWKRVS